MTSSGRGGDIAPTGGGWEDEEEEVKEEEVKEEEEIERASLSPSVKLVAVFGEA